eukprot:scaffold299772_cov37-Prasinocladus_malaysianus.AAC.2
MSVCWNRLGLVWLMWWIALSKGTDEDPSSTLGAYHNWGQEGEDTVTTYLINSCHTVSQSFHLLSHKMPAKLIPESGNSLKCDS